METQELMSVLEGTCPDCGADVEIRHIAGFASEIDEAGYELPESVKPLFWKDEMPHTATVLSIEFVCTECGHVHYVEKNRWGDWS